MQMIREKKLGMAIAKAIGINRQAISQWPAVPANRVLAVSAITGRPPHLIRPDIYLAPAATADTPTKLAPDAEPPPAAPAAATGPRNRRVTPA